jgi:hypothetical protein
MTTKHASAAAWPFQSTKLIIFCSISCQRVHGLAEEWREIASRKISQVSNR